VLEETGLLPRSKQDENKHGPLELRILVAEDNVLNQKLVWKVLEDFGCNVSLAENGRKALELLRKEKYNLILMDLHMPEMDGLEACKRIRQELQLKTPIIAMTAHSVTDEHQKAFDAGMNDVITKPFRPSELYDILQRYCSIPEREFNLLESEPPSLSEFHFHLEALKKACGGSEDLVKTLITLFIERMPEESKQLKLAVDAKDFAEVSQLAHKMKSSTALFGLEQLSRSLGELEDDAVHRATEGVANAIEIGILEFCELCARFDFRGQ
jgi:CheY-like chemotaxis protein